VPSQRQGERLVEQPLAQARAYPFGGAFGGDDRAHVGPPGRGGEYDDRRAGEKKHGVDRQSEHPPAGHDAVEGQRERPGPGHVQDDTGDAQKSR
jgi:hypothetical protein